MSALPPWFKFPQTATSARPPAADPSTVYGSNKLTENSSNNVLIIGAGLAGCALANTLANRKWQVTLIDSASKPATAASANNAALLRPHITRENNQASRFAINAFNETYNVLQQLNNRSATTDEPSIFHQCGALHLLHQATEYPQHDLYQKLDQTAAQALVGYPVASGGLFYPTAGYVDMPLLCQSLVQHPGIRFHPGNHVEALERLGNDWKVRCTTATFQADRVVLANGAGINKLPGMQELTLQAVRGQTTCIKAPDNQLAIAVCGHHTVIPINTKTSSVTKTTHWQISATYDREREVAVLDNADDQTNLLEAAHLLSGLNITNNDDADDHRRPSKSAAHKNLFNEPTQVIARWAGVRATTPDRLPILGPVPDFAFYHAHYADLQHGRPAERYPDAEYHPGLYVFGGLGSRGVSVAFYAARLLANQLHGKADDVDESGIHSMLHPARFLIRRLKRGKTTT